MNLNIRDFPDDLAIRARKKAADDGTSLHDYVISAIEASLSLKADSRVDDSIQVQCPICSLTGPLVMVGMGVARCWHCSFKFIAPEGL